VRGNVRGKQKEGFLWGAEVGASCLLNFESWPRVFVLETPALNDLPCLHMKCNAKLSSLAFLTRYVLQLWVLSPLSVEPWGSQRWGRADEDSAFLFTTLSAQTIGQLHKPWEN
jgi:hypothetical protein